MGKGLEQTLLQGGCIERPETCESMFSTAKEHSNKMKREPTIWENIFANDTSHKGLISKIYTELT